MTLLRKWIKLLMMQILMFRLENTVHLSVRSFSQTWTNANMPSMETDQLPSFLMNGRQESRQESLKVLKGVSSSPGLKPSTYRSTKSLRVQFIDDCSTEPLDQKQQTHSDFLDLRTSLDICSDLAKGAVPCQLDHKGKCLGYLDAAIDNYRHLFFPISQDVSFLEIKVREELSPLCEPLTKPRDHTLTIVDQLKLVRALVSATLHFYATPWLDDYWGLQDISFVRSGDEFSEVSLRSLHVSTDFAARSGSEKCNMDGIEEGDTNSSLKLSKVIEDARLQYGIRSLPLYSLGVVLLQIGQWTSIDPGDICQVRKLAEQSSRLGSRYKQITKKCLDCDFGFGTDLQTPQLQRAIQDGVLSELTAMISSLDISKD
jgi:hypothetical protein